MKETWATGAGGVRYSEADRLGVHLLPSIHPMTSTYVCTEGCDETFTAHEEWLAHEANHLRSRLAAAERVVEAARAYVENREEINRAYYSREKDLAARRAAADESGRRYIALRDALAALEQETDHG